MNHAARWAAALAVTETVRHVAAILSDGEQPTASSQLAYLRRTTVLVEQTGAIEPPTARHAWLLDRPLPSPVTAHDTTRDTVGEAMVALAHHTRPGTDLSVAEVLAVCIAAETACRHTPVSEDIEPALAKTAAAGTSCAPADQRRQPTTARHQTRSRRSCHPAPRRCGHRPAKRIIRRPRATLRPPHRHSTAASNR